VPRIAVLKRVTGARRLILEGSDVYDGNTRKCLRFSYCMNGYHSGMLRVYVRLGGGPRNVRWQMHGDQLPGWKSADIELNMTAVTEVRP